MSLPENLAISSLSDCQFYQKNAPSISVVHRHTPPAAQVSQHTNPSSPLPSPLHQLHHPQVGGQQQQQSHTYNMRSNSHGSLESHKVNFKHNQGGPRGQHHSQGNFSPQHRFSQQQGQNPAAGFRNQQHYNQNTWRRRKRDDPPSLNQSRWKTEAACLDLSGLNQILRSCEWVMVSVGGSREACNLLWNLKSFRVVPLRVKWSSSPVWCKRDSYNWTQYSNSLKPKLCHIQFDRIQKPFLLIWCTPAQT